MLRNTILALGLALSVLDLHAQSFFESFDSPGALANNFNVYQNTTPPVVNVPTNSPYSQSLTGGVGGSGAVSILPGGTTVTQDATLIQKNTVFDFSHVGVTLTVASWLNVSTQTAGGNRLLQLGFVNESTNGLNGNAGLAFTSLRLSSTGTSGNVYTPQWQTKTAAGSTVTPALTPNVTLIAGEWYELEGSFLNLGGGNILATGFLQDYGTSGVIPGSIVYSFPSTTLTSADIASDPTVYAALRGFKNDGLNTVDNFLAASVIPEPGTVSLVLLGLTAFAARARKQRN
jgi:hypothetical protein